MGDGLIMAVISNDNFAAVVEGRCCVRLIRSIAHGKAPIQNDTLRAVEKRHEEQIMAQYVMECQARDLCGLVRWKVVVTEDTKLLKTIQGYGCL